VRWAALGARRSSEDLVGQLTVIMIRRLAPDDLEAVANLHVTAFPQSALSRLGPAIVARYYGWQLLGPHDCVAVVALEGARIRAFCIGGAFRGALSGFLRKHRRTIALRMLSHPWLLGNEIVRDRMLSRLRRIRQREPKSGGLSDSRRETFGILAIAVDPEYQRSGLGRLLMDEMEREARTRDFDDMGLTVHIDNVGAVRFYERLGWRKVTARGRWNGRMTKSLGAAADAGTRDVRLDERSTARRWEERP
jgi:ribosomal protein S18 acetylase RimI-like enzyme